MTEFWRWPRVCPLCFEQRPVDELYVDPSGQRWDTCLICEIDEAYAMHHIFTRNRLDERLARYGIHSG